MAKMSVEFDTESKVFAATIDGKKVPDVMMVEIRPSWEDEGKYSCAFMTRSTDEKTGIHEMRHIYASQTPAAKAAVVAGEAKESAEFPGFVDAKSSEKSNAVIDIENFLKK